MGRLAAAVLALAAAVLTLATACGPPLPVTAAPPHARRTTSSPSLDPPEDNKPRCVRRRVRIPAVIGLRRCVELRYLASRQPAPGSLEILFRAECAGEPEAGLTTRDLRVTEGGEVVASARRLASAAGRVARSVWMLVDLSHGFADRHALSWVRGALLRLGHRLLSVAPLSLAAFDGRPDPWIVATAINTPRALRAALAKLRPAPDRVARRNLLGGITRLIRRVDGAGRPGAAWRQPAILFVTDGPDETKALRYPDAVRRAADFTRRGGLIFGLGLGEQVDAVALEELGRSESFRLARISSIGTRWLHAVAQRMLLHFHSLYVLRYCATQRSAKRVVRLEVNKQPRARFQTLLETPVPARAICRRRIGEVDCRYAQCGGPAPTLCAQCPAGQTCFNHRCLDTRQAAIESHWQMRAPRRTLEQYLALKRRYLIEYQRCRLGRAPIDQ